MMMMMTTVSASTFPATFAINFVLSWQVELFDLAVNPVRHGSSLYTSFLQLFDVALPLSRLYRFKPATVAGLVHNMHACMCRDCANKAASNWQCVNMPRKLWWSFCPQKSLWRQDTLVCIPGYFTNVQNLGWWKQQVFMEKRENKVIIWFRLWEKHHCHFWRTHGIKFLSG